MFLGLLLFVCLIGLMGASLALTMAAVLVLTVVAGLCSATGAVDSAKTIVSQSAIDSWAPAAFGAATAMGLAFGAGWLPGL